MLLCYEFVFRLMYFCDGSRFVIIIYSFIDEYWMWKDVFINDSDF